MNYSMRLSSILMLLQSLCLQGMFNDQHQPTKLTWSETQIIKTTKDNDLAQPEEQPISWSLFTKKGLSYVGWLQFNVYAVDDVKTTVKEFLCEALNFADGYDASYEKLIKGCDYLVNLEEIKLYQEYQKMGLGKAFMHEFIDYIRAKLGNNCTIFIYPQQSFTRKPHEKEITDIELQKRLVGFYKKFGAQEIKELNGWLYIDLRKKS